MQLDHRLRLNAGVASAYQGKVLLVLDRTGPRPADVRLNDFTIVFLFLVVLFLFNDLIVLLGVVIFLLIVAIGVLDALELLEDFIVLGRALLGRH